MLIVLGPMVNNMDRLLGLQEVEAPRISRQLVHEGGKVVSPTNRPPLPPREIPDANFCYRPCPSQGHIASGRIRLLKNLNEPALSKLPAQYGS